MAHANKWYVNHRLWLEAFVLSNFAFLSLDIYLAHSMNQFRRPAEYIPLGFSVVAPIVLLVGLLAWWINVTAVWKNLGYLVGWLAVVVGLTGVILHLESRFFEERTIKSLVYAAPFAAPLAYTGLGLLLIMNRMIEGSTTEWAQWVSLLALGGFAGNFVFSLTDHAQNGFFYPTEWIPVVSSAFAVGFLAAPFFTPVGRPFHLLTGYVLLLQAGVGLWGFYFHTTANLRGPSSHMLDNFIHGAPAMAPLLFPNLVLLAGIGLWVLLTEHPSST
jgi:hypothetical protein